jgi:hypothetical protein
MLGKPRQLAPVDPLPSLEALADSARVLADLVRRNPDHVALLASDEGKAVVAALIRRMGEAAPVVSAWAKQQLPELRRRFPGR